MNQKVALVTGGMGGIGTAICQKLAHDGYLVATTYHKGGNHDVAKQWQEAQAKLGFDFFATYCDVADHASCELMAKTVKEVLGSVSVLVNNAGIAQDTTLRKMTEAQWLAVLNTNVNGLFHVTKQFVNDMLSQQYGRIINISSINGQKGQRGQTNYATSKAAVHGFTKSLAQEVAYKGITVNTVSPGYIDTDMMAAVPQEILANIVQQIPVGRLGQPDEIAHLVAFLVDKQAAFITGSNFAINGGQHMY